MMRKHERQMALEHKKQQHQQVTDAQKHEREGLAARLQADPQGAVHMQALDAMHKLLSAPAIIERDPVTGRAIGIRRTPMN